MTKGNNHKSLFKCVITISLYLIVAAFISAQSTPDVLGFDKGSFDYYMGKADREVSPDKWMIEARSGVSLAMKSWERLATTLYSDEAAFSEAGRNVEKWSEEELEKRFTEWLKKRFFGEGAEKVSEKVSEGVKEANLKYLYHTDDDGNIKYDEVTGDPSLYRPDEGRNIEEDRVSFRSVALSVGKEELTNYEASLESLYPELLTYISFERRGEFEELLKGVISESVLSRQKEIEALLAREERLFVSRRLGDIWSLRKKSESEAASVISGNLIEETEKSCAIGIASLEARIEAAKGGTGDLALLGEEWLREFEEQFNRGLKAWEQAEERFFLNRVEWEKEAGKHFMEGEEAWSKAFSELEKERKNWESKAKALFEAGEETFKQASEKLQKAIYDAKVEFEKDSLLRSQAGQERAKAWVDTYITCGQVITGAKDNINYWLGKLPKTDKELGTEALTEWAVEELKKIWQKAQSDYEKDVRNVGEFSELRKYEERKEWTELDTRNIYLSLDARLKATQDLIAEKKEKCEEAWRASSWEDGTGSRNLAEKLEKEIIALENEVRDVIKPQLNIFKPFFDNYSAAKANATEQYNYYYNLINYDEKHWLYQALEKAKKGEIEDEYLYSLGNSIAGFFSTSGSFDSEKVVAALEVKRWSELYINYMAKAKEAREALEKDFDLAIGSGLLADVLKEGITSEDFHLDEYQIELIRCKAIAGYWQKKVEIAEAVSDYAADLTAGRTTDAESVKRWNDAKESYNLALLEYQKKEEELSSAGSTVEEKRNALNTAAAALAEADRTLEELNAEYSLQMAAYIVNDNSFILTDIGVKYKELLEQRGVLKHGGEGAIYISYLERARELGVSNLVESGYEVLRVLVQGEDGGKSLSKLKEEAENIITIDNINSIPTEIANLGIDENNSYYGLVSYLYLERNNLLQAAPDSEKAEITKRYGKLIISTVEEAKLYAESLLEKRIAGISLLHADSITDWYFAISGKERTENNENRVIYDGVLNTLTKDKTEAEKNLLKERASLEYESLSWYLGDSHGAGEEVKLLSSFINLEDEYVPDAKESLLKLLEIINTENLTQAEYKNKIEQLSQENDFARMFLRGKSFFGLKDGGDITDLFLSEEVYNLRKINNMIALYDEIETSSSAIEKEEVSFSITALKDIFSDYGISYEEEALPGMKTIGSALVSKGGDPLKTTADFLYRLDTELPYLPGWLDTELRSWESALLEYMAAKSLNSNIQISLTKENINSSIETTQNLITNIQKVTEVIDFYGPGNAKALCMLLEEGEFPLGLVTKSMVLGEAARRVGRELAVLNGTADTSDEEALKALLKEAANLDFSYASEEIRGLAVEEAVKILKGTAENKELPESLIELSKKYSRPDISGDIVTWSLSQYPDDGDAVIALSEYIGIETENIRDFYLDLISYELDKRYGKLINDLKLYSYEYGFAESYEKLKTEIATETAAGRKHFRQYITEGTVVIDDYNKLKLVEDNEDEKLTGFKAGDAEGDISLLIGANTYKEGVLADAFEKAERELRKLEEAFNIYNENSVTVRESSFKETLESYLSNSTASWDDDYETATRYELYDSYYKSLDELQSNYGTEKALCQELKRLGVSYIVSKDLTVLQTQINELSKKLDEQRDVYKNIAEGYRTKAEDFKDAGEAYEVIYKEAKKSYDIVEDSRFQYEKEDAIRRWASTSYLYLEGELSSGLNYYREPKKELEYSKEHLYRANVALNALKNLYDNGEEKRPYNDSEYNDLYREYQESFTRMITTLKIKKALDGELEAELRKNEELYQSYYKAMFETLKTGNVSYTYTNDIESENSSSTWSNFLIIKDGKLTLNYDSTTNTLAASTEEMKKEVEEYLSLQKKEGSELNALSDYERDIIEWSSRMASYNFNDDRYKQWGLARDYLLTQITNKYSVFSGVLSQSTLDNIKKMKIKGAGTIEKILSDYRRGSYEYTVTYQSDGDTETRTMRTPKGLPEAKAEAWTNLTPQQKEDLEFYIIMTLLGGGGDSAKAFSQISALKEYEAVEDKFYDRWPTVRRRNSYWIVGRIWRNEYKELKQIREQFEQPLNKIKNSVSSSTSSLNSVTGSVLGTYKEYIKSCERISKIMVQKKEGESITLGDIFSSMDTAGIFKEQDKKDIEKYWNEMISDKGNVSYSNVDEALKGLITWSRNTREDVKTEFEKSWEDDEKERKKAEKEYRETLEGYIAGTKTKTELDVAALKAYGDESPARKNHLSNLEETIMKDLSGIMDGGNGYGREYLELANEYASLIGRVYRMRFDSELSARESEWQQQLYDLSEKQNAWREAAGLILERGRNDFKEGIGKMQERYILWQKQFEEEYLRVSEVWDASYLEGLKEKEKWVGEATEAANNGAKGAMLALVGSSAESMSRKFDTLGAVSVPGFGGIEEAENALSEVLSSSGILNLGSAFSSITGSAKTIASEVRRGLGGLGVWNSGLAQAAASDFARKTNQELAARQSRIIASRARDMAELAMKSLEENLVTENKNFSENMDDTFIMQGHFKRTAGGYSKDVIVHSTLFSSVITKRADVEGYRFYTMAKWELKTDLRDETLSGLDSRGIEALIALAEKEVAEKSKEVFGEEDKKGLFGNWIGDAPKTKDNANVEDGKEKIWKEYGTGELGRLMRDYIYWSMKEGAGMAAFLKPVWDKPMWDDRGSWFKAPTIRSAVDVGVAIAAAVLAPVTGGASLLLSVALNMIDDAVFMAMDVAGGYKSFEDAGMAFGKKALTTAATSFAGAAFSGVSAAAGSSATTFLTKGGIAGALTKNVASTVSKVAIKTAVTGVQTIATSAASSAINAVNWSSSSGFGFSKSAYKNGLSSIGSIASSMASTMVTSSLGEWNTGNNNSKLLGFSKTNQKDVGAFNSLAGGLAGQAVGYAFGGNINLNLVNFSMFGIKGVGVDEVTKMGLFELNIGRNGITGNIGTGGLDVSLGNIASAMRGADVLKTNSKINNYAKDNDTDINVLLRAQYGFGDKTQKENLFDVLNGNAVLNMIGANSKYSGKTTLDEAGRRVIEVAGDKNGMSAEQQMAMATIMGHEAYRDGVAGDNNYLETRDATRGHTEMAIRMILDGQNIALNENLMNDITAYMKSQGNMNSFNSYVDASYDSSSDYWKVMKDGSIFDDGKNGEISFEDGRATIYTENKGKQGSLEEYLGLKEGTGYSLLMKDAGFEYNTVNKTWTASGKTISAEAIKSLTEQGVVTNQDIIPTNYMPKEISFINDLVDIGKKILDGGKSLWNKITEKNGTSTNVTALEKKYKDVAGLPYAENYKEQQVFDENGVITKDSTGMNCIGFVTYMFGVNAKYSVRNFEQYSEFEKLNATSVNNLQTGDVIRFRATNKDGEYDDHVQIWAGDGKVWESTSSARLNGVRYDDLYRMTRYYNKEYGNNYQMDYFRYKKK